MTIKVEVRIKKKNAQQPCSLKPTNNPIYTINPFIEKSEEDVANESLDEKFYKYAFDKLFGFDICSPNYWIRDKDFDEALNNYNVKNVATTLNTTPEGQKEIQSNFFFDYITNPKYSNMLMRELIDNIYCYQLKPRTFEEQFFRSSFFILNNYPDKDDPNKVDLSHVIFETKFDNTLKYNKKYMYYFDDISGGFFRGLRNAASSVTSAASSVTSAVTSTASNLVPESAKNLASSVASSASNLVPEAAKNLASKGLSYIRTREEIDKKEGAPNVASDVTKKASDMSLVTDPSATDIDPQELQKAANDQITVKIMQDILPNTNVNVDVKKDIPTGVDSIIVYTINTNKSIESIDQDKLKDTVNNLKTKFATDLGITDFNRIKVNVLAGSIKFKITILKLYTMQSFIWDDSFILIDRNVEEWKIKVPSPYHEYYLYHDDTDPKLLRGIMNLSENQDNPFKWRFDVSYIDPSSNTPSYGPLINNKIRKPREISYVKITMETNKYKNMEKTKQFLSFFSPSTPTTLKSKFMITKIGDKRLYLEDKLKGLDGVGEGFWNLYADKTFGTIFLNGFKITLLNTVLKL